MNGSPKGALPADSSPLRIGILGAARIAPAAVIRPARLVPGVQVTAIAARDPERGRRFAAQHRIPVAHASYADVIADSSIDAVYIPLPNSLHCEWTLRALEAGKHVLCEKPLAANAHQAQHMAQVAGRAQGAPASGRGLVLMEAFHYRYHPLAARMRAIVTGGELGPVRHIETSMCIPLLRPNDIRFRFDLAGGAVMDTGCYAIHMARYLAGAEPTVLSAQARLRSPQVDRHMQARLSFPDGCTGRIECSLLSPKLLHIQAVVTGEHGVMRVINPVLPHLFHVIRVRTAQGSRWERVRGQSTYTHQLRAFVDAVREPSGRGNPPPTGPADAVANMRVIDAIYTAAGLRLRGT